MRLVPSFLRPSTLAGRLLLGACLFVTAALVVAGVIIAVILDHVVTDQVEQRLQAQANALSSALTVDANGAARIGTGLDTPPFDRRGSGWTWQIEGAANTLRSRSLGSGDLTAPSPPLDWRRLLSGRSPAVAGTDDKGRPLHIVTLMTSKADRAITIRVSAPTSAIVDPLRRALFWLIPSVGSLGLALIGATLLQIRLGLKPLRTLRDSVQSVRSGTLSRLPTDQPAELAPVVAEMNGLIDQNEARLAGSRLHLANMAHSLKTPLASLSLALRDKEPPASETLLALTDQIERRLRHHLGRARADTGAGMSRARLRVAPCLEDLAGVMEKIYRERGLELTLALDPDATVACEEQDFNELAGNLIDNAFKWASTTVSISAAAQDGRVLIVIEDDGAGIPQEAVASVLLPGRRLDETVPGHGFGLSVSQELITLYGGSLRLDGKPGRGLYAVVDLPSA